MTNTTHTAKFHPVRRLPRALGVVAVGVIALSCGSQLAERGAGKPANGRIDHDSRIVETPAVRYATDHDSHIIETVAPSRFSVDHDSRIVAAAAPKGYSVDHDSRIVEASAAGDRSVDHDSRIVG